MHSDCCACVAAPAHRGVNLNPMSDHEDNDDDQAEYTNLYADEGAGSRTNAKKKKKKTTKAKKPVTTLTTSTDMEAESSASASDNASGTEFARSRMSTVDSVTISELAGDADLFDPTSDEPLVSSSSAPDPNVKYCCGQEEKKFRVIILYVATAVLILSAVAAAVSVSVTAPSCAKGYCSKYESTPVVLRSMPGQAPSFLRFSQTSHEKSTCTAPRAFVVGGLFTAGWAQRWALYTADDAEHLFDSSTDLVSNSSGLLNWPHSVIQDACTGSIYIANANDNVIDKMGCLQPVANDDEQVRLWH